MWCSDLFEEFLGERVQIIAKLLYNKNVKSGIFWGF
jgi:hypothetical protein